LEAKGDKAGNADDEADKVNNRPTPCGLGMRFPF